MSTPQRAIDLFQCAVSVMEHEPKSILAVGGPGAESTAALIRAFQFALSLMLQAIELADAAGDTNMARAVAARAEKLHEHIKGLRVELAAWLELPLLLAQDEAERATKH